MAWRELRFATLITVACLLLALAFHAALSDNDALTGVATLTALIVAVVLTTVVLHLLSHKSMYLGVRKDAPITLFFSGVFRSFLRTMLEGSARTGSSPIIDPVFPETVSAASAVLIMMAVIVSGETQTQIYGEGQLRRAELSSAASFNLETVSFRAL